MSYPPFKEALDRCANDFIIDDVRGGTYLVDQLLALLRNATPEELVSVGLAAPPSPLRESCTREGCTGSRTQHGPNGATMIRCPLTPAGKLFALNPGAVHYTGPVECPFMEQALADRMNELAAELERPIWGSTTGELPGG